MAKPAISVLVPCFNEEASVPHVVARLAALRDQHALEAVFVDDGSSDRTWATLESVKTEWMQIVRHPRNLGLAAAWQTAAEHARADLVCLLDADLQYRPEDIGVLLTKMREEDAALVQGARRWVERTPATRYAVSRATSALLNALFGMALDDNKSGFVLCEKAVLLKLLEGRTRYRYFQLFLLVAAKAHGFRFASIDVDFEPRRHGTSFLPAVPIRTMARALVDVGRAVIDYRLTRPAR